MRDDLKRRVIRLGQEVAELTRYRDLLEELRKKYHPTREEILEKIRPKRRG